MEVSLINLSFSDDWPEISHSPQSPERDENPPRKSMRKLSPTKAQKNSKQSLTNDDVFPPVKIHRSVVDGSRKRICEICGGEYAGLENYKRHYERMHLKIKKFACDMCGYRAYKKKDVSSHLASHLKVKFHESCFVFSFLFFTDQKSFLSSLPRFVCDSRQPPNSLADSLRHTRLRL